MVVLVCLTTKNKPFPVCANSLGLEKDAKLRKVILKHNNNNNNNNNIYIALNPLFVHGALH